MASPKYLRASERMLITGDFPSRIAQAASAQVVGIGALIEKTFEGERSR